MNILELHKEFRRSCTFEEQLSQGTIKGLRLAVEVLAKRTGVENLKEVTVDVLRDFFHEGVERYEWSYSTFVNYHKYLKKFFAWCVDRKYIKKNLVLDIKKPKKPQTLPRRLTYDDAQKILQVTLNHNWFYEFEHARNYAIVSMLLYAGLRVGELINLSFIDVNLDVGNILVRKGKGNKDRNVPIHSKLRYILKHYLVDRKRLNKISDYFFVSAQSNRGLAYKDVAKICKKISIESGIRFTPHRLRHTFGSVAVEQGVGLVQLKEIMGHSDIKSTMIYMKMSSKGLQESLNRVELF